VFGAPWAVDARRAAAQAVRRGWGSFMGRCGEFFGAEAWCNL
jgi:hypothetical protein